MASGSNPTRINQFFASKKKQNLTQSSYGKTDKDVKGIQGGSPSGKGSLDNFLATTHDNYGSSVTQGPVKRKLPLTSVLSSKDGEVDETLSLWRQTKTQPDNQTENANCKGNSELKQFATDFLSLYCRELPSVRTPLDVKVNSLKRQGSPSVLAEDKSPKKRNCSQDAAEHFSDQASSYHNKKHPQLDGISKPGDTLVCSKEGSLRKCMKMTVSGFDMSACDTISPVGVAIESRVTPNSTRGSSLFSPGDSFWKEAIQVADGFATSNNFVSFEQSQINNANNIGSRVHMSGTGKLFYHDNSMASCTNIKGCSNLGKEASPLPVKHIDFSFEDRNIDGEIQTCATGNTLNGFTISEADQRERTTKKELHDRLDMTIKNTTVKRESKIDITLGTPDISIKRVIAHEYIEDGTPSSLAPLKVHLEINHWLPSELCMAYKKKGISKLYPWQVECLQTDGVLEKRNLVYCASTSAGKSFVAEILMLRRVLNTGKIAFLVLPYVSICAEKATHLEVLLEPLGKHVRSYFGSQGGGTLPKDTAVAVCTIEKANSLINRLLEEGRLSEVGIIVVDELHMVGDQNRGYLLELLLTKLLYAAGEGVVESPSSGGSSGSSSGKADSAHGLQIVGMSATLPNVAAVAEWLQAALYQTEFRPVPLEEYIKVGNSIYDREMKIVRTISKAADLGGRDPDHVVELCNEVVQEGNSVLIFCSSRKGCESTAKHVAKFIKKFPVTYHNGQSEFDSIDHIIDALRKSPGGLDPVLEETIPCGVAYHHAGLTVEEREIVETCYRKGIVRVLTATSTLAAGVNLPARRVIFRQPRIGRDFVDGTRYRQMSGRAGRTGIDTKGESILICKPEEVKRVTGIINDSCPPLNSCLSEDKNGMTHAILEVVAGGIVQTAKDINRYVRCTLLNSTKPFEDVVKSAQDSLRWLCKRRFLEWNEDTKLYSTTSLGRASFGSSLCPEESLIVLDDLSRAREGFVLASDLHLVYLVTPINVDMEPNWELYYERFMQLSALDQSVGNRVGVMEPFLMHRAHGAPMQTSKRSKENKDGSIGSNCQTRSTNPSLLSNEQTNRVCRRFYIGLILSRLVQEVPVTEVCEAFKVARGTVQSLQENAGRFASMVSVFCERLGWHDLEGLISKFQNRVSFGVRAEIVELTTIPYVKGSRARALYKSGLRTPQAIAEASIAEVFKALFESSSWASEENSGQRRVQLGVVKKIKNGARKIVLEKAEEARLVAFSAFKSLGLDIPQFSRPLVLEAVHQANQNDAEEEYMRDDSENAQSHQNIEKFTSEVVEKVKASNVDTETSVKTNAISKIPSVFRVAGVNQPIKELQTHSENCSTVMVDATETKAVGNQMQNVEMSLCTNMTDKGPINAVNHPDGFDAFLNHWESMQEFFFDIYFNKRAELSSLAPFEVHGIAICWENSPVYYVNLPKDLFWSIGSGYSLPESHQLDRAKQRWSRISFIMGKNGVRKFTWNLKVQIQALKSPAISMNRFGSLSSAVKAGGVELVDNLYYMLPPVHLRDGVDMCIVSWILWPDDERSSNPNLEKEFKKRLTSEAVSAANRSGRWKNHMRRVAHNGCCRRVAQTRALHSSLWKLLISEDLLESLVKTEIPLVNVLADMEMCGIGVDLEGCLRARQLLGRKLKILEKEAYELAGMTFSLYTSSEIADVLYTHLKLPIPEGSSKGKRHPSTDKHCLDLLRLEHPIIPVIKEHRTLSKLLNSTLGSICSLSKLSIRTQRYKLHGHWLQTSTATGRLSIEEPNLQCVEHAMDISMKSIHSDGDDSQTDEYKINARDFLVPTEDNWVLLTADYSQIELRLMAHFSKDALLVEILNKPHGDVFTMIAARWTGKEESCISTEERDQTKKLVYGILYGMGPNSLSKQLNCSLDDAADKIHSFRSSFPGVSSWLQESVASCHHKGFIETLIGRKRFLAKIKYGNSKEKSKAQRQAVNSICQGSAADIIKIAMINLHSLIAEDNENIHVCKELASKFHMLRGHCRILLQVHDELVIEADPSVKEEAAMFLRMSMESAASLIVPLRVKLMVGRTWGSLEPFESENS
ncbi:helicase and polymerase-containing protein TEBICHI [Impatiens glandulifera]|uniref:helicase and polymerase-containing protein TEBICHI n=1 Tax=Impatiens glandulifera TaxID=253017 RepID=UPI001FB1224E|nr:helicase and polymerase-containing protein TEBICHI [Impatiens glandulifera]